MLNKLKKKAQKIGGKGAAFIAQHMPSTVCLILNKYIGEYGEISALRFDKQRRVISMALNLHGESQSIQLTISDFELNNSNSTIIIKSISCERVWIEALVKKFVEGKELELPEDLIPVFEGLLGS